MVHTPRSAQVDEWINNNLLCVPAICEENATENRSLSSSFWVFRCVYFFTDMISTVCSIFLSRTALLSPKHFALYSHDPGCWDFVTQILLITYYRDYPIVSLARDSCSWEACKCQRSHNIKQHGSRWFLFLKLRRSSFPSQCEHVR